ncbi:MAG: hypothetical protein MZV64_10040 [Ignavibacteriales bacterium]|nr:hypothetical protein [Ignavibacteriales bacterium]
MSVSASSRANGPMGTPTFKLTIELKRVQNLRLRGAASQGHARRQCPDRPDHAA